MKIAKDQTKKQELTLGFLEQVGEPIEHLKEETKPKTKEPRALLPMVGSNR